MGRKLLKWVPYVVTMFYLSFLITWIRVKTCLSESDCFLLGSMIVLYGAFVVGSSDLRRYMNRKEGRGSCGQCQFWVEDINEDRKEGQEGKIGHCHKIPPMPIRLWSQTFREEWCGSFSRRPKKAK